MNHALIRKFVAGPDSRTQWGVESLTDRELEILQLVGKGRTSREIASDIHISVKTVETHRGNLKDKLALKTGTELIRFAVEYLGNRV